MRKILFIMGLSLICFLGSCNSDIVYDNTQTVNEKAWKRKDKLEFVVNITDTHSFYDFALNVRNTTDYPYCNIYFFVKTTFPDGSVRMQDTVECYVAYLDGGWNGNGSGHIKDNRFWFTQKVAFPQKGKYRFEITQATRDTSLLGIKDVGLHIEYHTEKNNK
jgi:gliding motility-associated lipoprotein GldH